MRDCERISESGRRRGESREGKMLNVRASCAVYLKETFKGNYFPSSVGSKQKMERKRKKRQSQPKFGVRSRDREKRREPLARSYSQLENGIVAQSRGGKTTGHVGEKRKGKTYYYKRGAELGCIAVPRTRQSGGRFASVCNV